MPPQESSVYGRRLLHVAGDGPITSLDAGEFREVVRRTNRLWHEWQQEAAEERAGVLALPPN